MATILWKDLPYDVVVDILSRLPAKTLMSLRRVCKLWYSIIIHPTFITMHLNRACLYNNNNGYYLQYLNLSSYSRQLAWCLLCEHTYKHHVELEIPTPINSPESMYFPVLVGAFNGLVCLSDDFNFGLTLCLWNPSIRKSKTVSLSSSIFPFPQHSKYKNYFALGFGFHSRTNDYKIVRILYCSDVDCEYIANSPPPVEVYSLRTDSWRRIEALVPCYGSYPLSDAFFNGALHWVACRSVAHPDHHNTIMTFDIGGEVFGEMTLPNFNIDGVALVDLKLALLKESLSLCACFDEGGHCDIWVMGKYGVVESWTKQFTIVLPRAKIQRFFGVPKKDVLLLETSRSELFSYDLGSLQLKNLGIRVVCYTSYVFPYMETLVLL